MANQKADWLVKSIEYYRALGFFTEHATLSHAQLAAHLEQRAAERHGALDPSDELSDLILLSLDDRRVWWDDTEADVCAENLVYEQTLRQWAAISRGSFAPENIRESWASAKGPIDVAFQLLGRAMTLRPEFMDDYIDVAILGSINYLIQDTGIQFCVHAIFDQTAFVVALTASEKKKLEQERGWRFAF